MQYSSYHSTSNKVKLSYQTLSRVFHYLQMLQCRNIHITEVRTAKEMNNWGRLDPCCRKSSKYLKHNTALEASGAASLSIKITEIKNPDILLSLASVRSNSRYPTQHLNSLPKKGRNETHALCLESLGVCSMK